MSVFVEKTLAEEGFAATWARTVTPSVMESSKRSRRRTMFASLATGITVGLSVVSVLLQMRAADAAFLASPVNHALVLALAALAAIGAWVNVLRGRESHEPSVRKAVEAHFANILSPDDNAAFGQVIIEDLIGDGVLQDRDYELSANYAGTYGDCRIRIVEAAAGLARGHRHDRVILSVFRVSLPASLRADIRIDSRADRLKALMKDRSDLVSYRVDHDQFDGIFAVASTDMGEAARFITDGLAETLLRVQEHLASPLAPGVGEQPRLAAQASESSLLLAIETPANGGAMVATTPTSAEALARHLIMRFATAPALVDDLHGGPEIPPAFAPLPLSDDPQPTISV